VAVFGRGKHFLSASSFNLYKGEIGFLTSQPAHYIISYFFNLDLMLISNFIWIVEQYFFNFLSHSMYVLQTFMLLLWLASIIVKTF
jgi:hypothetical protein